MKNKRGALALTATAALALAASALGASGHQKIVLTDTSSHGKQSPIHVLAAGPLTGSGTAVLADSSSNSRVDHLTVRFPKGVLRLVAIEKHTKVTPHLTSCYAVNTGEGSWTISGGSGAYRGATGRGTYERHGVLYGAHSASGACIGRSAPPARTRERIVLTGSVTLPSA